MTKTKTILLVFSLFSLAALSGSFWSFFQKDTTPGGIRITPVADSAAPRQNAVSRNAFVKGESSETAVNLATTPLLDLEWEQVVRKNRTSPYYKNGDLVITPDEELRIAANAVTSSAIRRHAIEAVDIDTNSVTSRTIKDRTISSRDLAHNLTIDNLSIGESFSASNQNAFQINPFGIASGNTGELRLLELAANGVNYVGFKSPDAITGNIIWSLPAADGTANQILTTNGSGSLEWQTAGAGLGAPTSASYITATTESGLSAERIITGTANQVTVTDNGGVTGTLVLSLPQNIHTTASPIFSALTLSALTANAFIYSGTGGTLTATTAPTNGQLLIGSTGVAPVVATLSGDATLTNAGVLTIAANAVALATDTTGNYVASANTSVLTGLTGGSAGSEGAALTLAFDYTTALSGDPALLANNIIFGTNGLVFEGATANTFETFLTITDATADRTLTLPNETGTICTTGSVCSGYQASITNPVTGTGTNGYNAYWNATGSTLGAEQYVAMTRGGTGTTLTANNGGIVYSNASTLAILSGTATAGQALVSGASSAPSWFAPTLGSILFAGTGGILEQDNASLFFDNTNNRLGIGDVTPDGVLDFDLTSTATTAATEYGGNFTINDTGIVTTGTDTTYGTHTFLMRTGATGGTIDTYGSYSYILGDSGGASSTYGQYIQAWGGDTVTGSKAIALGNAGTTTMYGIDVSSSGFIGGAGITTYGARVVATDSFTGGGTLYGVHSTVTSSAGGTATGLYVDAGTGAGTEYAGIFVNGNVGIGTATPGARLNVISDIASDYAAEFFNDGNATTRWGLLVQAGLDDQTAAGPNTLIQFNDGDGGAVGSITFGSSVTNYNTTSDERLKKNIRDTALGLDELMQIQVRDYSWKADSGERVTHGFIAQELYAIYPDAVTVPQDDRYWMVDYSKLTPLIVQSIQDQQGQITLQGDRLASISLKTAENITTLAGLQASVDTQLTVVGSELSALTTKDTALDTALALHTAQFVTDETRLTALETLTDQLTIDINAQTTQTTLLETQMQTLTEQVQTLTDFYATFDLGNLVAKDALGNVDLTVDALGNPILLGGKLKAVILETGALTIEVVDADAPTIGTATLLKGEKTIVIPTTAVQIESKIFVTPVASIALESPLTVLKKEDGESFEVGMPKALENDITFDWWIVESR